MSSSEIDRQASEWIVRLDEDRSASTRSDFEAWCGCDARHRAAYLRQLETWTRLDRLQALRPPRSERATRRSTLRRWLPRRRPKGLHRWLAAGLAALVVLSVTLNFVLRESGSTREDASEYVTGVGGFERVVLSDGSIVELNTNSRMRVALERHRRVIHLDRGEATFRVAHDAQRPFLVMVGGTVVRAIGTQFNVRRREEAVEVLVLEGVVALDSIDALGSRLAVPLPTTPVLNAGKIAIAEPTGLKVRDLEAEEAGRTLAWRSGMLSFNGQTLGEAAAEFNRYNRRQLVLADPEVAALRIGGTFRATNVDSFAAVLQEKFHVKVVSEDERIVLSAEPKEEYRKVTG